MPFVRYRSFSLYPGFSHSLDPNNCKPYCIIRLRKHRHKKLKGATLVMLNHGIQGPVHTIPLFCNDVMYSRKPYCMLMLGAETLKKLTEITLAD